MISRSTKEYNEAKYRVKVSWFTESGYDLSGIVHIGANDGYEVRWYRILGCEPVVCFEPFPEAQARFHSLYDHDPAVTLVESALGNVNGIAVLNVTAGDGQGSSLLHDNDLEKHGYTYAAHIHVPVRRFADWARATAFDPSLFNCLVCDVQGAEMDVLRGMDDYLKGFSFLNIECSREPLYFGGSRAEEVVAFLDGMGFEARTEIPEHDDIMFVRKGL